VEGSGRSGLKEIDVANSSLNFLLFFCKKRGLICN
jgi:hypothetical protein